MAEAKILDLRKVPSTLDGRAGKTDAIVFYQVDGGRVYMVRVPEEGLTESAALAAVKKDADERGKFIGKSVPL